MKINHIGNKTWRPDYNIIAHEDGAVWERTRWFVQVKKIIDELDKQRVKEMDSNNRDLIASQTARLFKLLDMMTYRCSLAEGYDYPNED